MGNPMIDLNGFFNDVKTKKPVDDDDFIYYILAKEFGIHYGNLKDIPLPVIFSMLINHNKVTSNINNKVSK